jgi:type II secretory pathway pseudopilin PulG
VASGFTGLSDIEKLKLTNMKSKAKQVVGTQVSLNKFGQIRARMAFTLVELLVVVGVVALLGMTLVPIMAGSRVGSQGYQCMNNNRQLCAAWRMYADDNANRIVYSADDGSQSGANPNNYRAWTWTHMDYTASPYNYDPTLDITQRPLWPYTSKDASIYRCPSDYSYVVASGAARPRVRTLSLNLFVGGFAAPRGAAPDSPGNDGSIPFASPYRIFSKTTDLTAPGPANTFVFIDMRPESINWGNFAIDMTGFPNQPASYRFDQDKPGIFHNFGASVSFADGRAEIHRWKDARTAPPLPAQAQSTSAIPSPNNVDIAWLQARATSPK